MLSLLVLRFFFWISVIWKYQYRIKNTSFYSYWLLVNIRKMAYPNSGTPNPRPRTLKVESETRNPPHRWDAAPKTQDPKGWTQDPRNGTQKVDFQKSFSVFSLSQAIVNEFMCFTSLCLFCTSLIILSYRIYTFNLLSS